MRMAIALALGPGCRTAAEEPERLVMEGPSEVRVTELGPVDWPRVQLSSGEAADGVIWTMSRSGVARVDGERVVAIGPGRVEVTAEWEGERVSFVLAVELETTVAFTSPPSTLRVGEVQPLSIHATAEEQPVDPGPVRWTSSDAAVLAVDPSGAATGVRPGVAYVTAQAAAGYAMAEIEVVSNP